MNKRLFSFILFVSICFSSKLDAFSLDNEKGYYCSGKNCNNMYALAADANGSAGDDSIGKTQLSRQSSYFTSSSTMEINKNMSGIYLAGGYSQPAGISIETNKSYASSSSFKNIPTFSIGIGADVVVKNFLIGMEAFYTAPMAKYIIERKLAGATVTSTDQIKNIYGTHLKLGINIYDKLLTYAKIGIAMGDISDKLDSSICPTCSSSDKEVVPGVSFGGGVDLYLTRGVFIRLEYIESIFHAKFNGGPITYSDTNEQFYTKDELHYRTIMIGGGFKF